MNILVFTPVYRLEPETVESIFNLEWDGPITILLQKDNPSGDGKLDHYHQYQRGREVFLSGGYDAMLVIESDIIPPSDTLQRLVDLECDVAYGCYMFRVSPVVNVFEYYRKPGLRNYRARNIGESLTVRPGLWKQALKQGIVECSGAGLGCTLIRRNVLEAVPFRIEPNGAHCDSYWTKDVYDAGFKMMADTRVLCGHKREDGTVIWPPTA